MLPLRMRGGEKRNVAIPDRDERGAGRSRQVTQCPGCRTGSAGLFDGCFCRIVCQRIGKFFGFGRHDRQGVFLDGRGLEQLFENVYLRQIARFGSDRVVEIDSRSQFQARVDDDHFFQVVVSRCISRIAGKSVVRRLDDRAVFLSGVRRVDLQFLVLRIVHDETFPVRAVHGRVGEERQFHVIAELLAAVGIKRPGLCQFFIFGFRCSEGCRSH